MSKISFQKFHGFGNDYIVVTREAISAVTNLEAFTRAICNRHTGAGSDGIALLDNSDNPDADYLCRIINPDGSEVGFSGNGTRCAVAYLYRENIWTDESLRLDTKSGIKSYDFLKRAGEAFWFRAELGKPVFETTKVPFNRLAKGQDDVRFHGDTLTDDSSGEEFPYLTLNVGNPVCALFVESFDFHWRTIGAAIESHVCFPTRTNVVFVKPVDESNIEIRIWERGAGETSSSGTCSIAAAVASAFTERTVREVSVRAEGGITDALWRDDDEMLITGSAEYIFTGEWLLKE